MLALWVAWSDLKPAFAEAEEAAPNGRVRKKYLTAQAPASIQRLPHLLQSQADKPWLPIGAS